MNYFSKWFSINTKLKKQDVICVFINTKLELSLFYPFKNKIFFQKIEKFFEKKKENHHSPFIKYEFLKKFSEINIFFSFQKKQPNMRLILELFNKSKKLRTLFFISNKKIDKLFSPKNEYSSFLISLVLEFWTTIKIFNKNLGIKKLNSFKLIQFKKKKIIPRLFFLKWEYVFKYFCLKKTKIIGKMIKIRLFSQLMGRNFFTKNQEFFFGERKNFKNWSDIAQRIFGELGFISIGFQNLENHEILLLLNYF